MTAAVEVHGTDAGYHRHLSVEEEPCGSCKAAHNADERVRYARRVGRPVLPPLVDADPARAHILRLREAGWTWPAICAASGLREEVVVRLVRGRSERERGRRTTARIRQPHAEAILSLAPRLRPVVDVAPVGGVL